MSKVKIGNRKYSSKLLRKVMNFFPPLLVNRIKIVENDSDFMNLKVKVNYSWLNKNLQKAIFGGTIFSAIDPYYAVMYWQIFSTKGIPMEVWIKKVEIRYRKAATSNLEIAFCLTENDVKNAITGLKTEDKYEVWHDVNAIDENQEVCTEARVLVHIRNTKKHNLNIF
ncbi:MAG: YiiD C-terminal domain-containing protein [Flavobacteriales bacterium]|nr:YiiD C-terminal domain-containing protein [Flavobacteriales bacterium]